MTMNETLNRVSEFQKYLCNFSSMAYLAAKRREDGGGELEAATMFLLHKASHALEAVIKGVEPLEAMKRCFVDNDDSLGGA